jgi:hypothetical protein
MIGCLLMKSPCRPPFRPTFQRSSLPTKIDVFEFTMLYDAQCRRRCDHAFSSKTISRESARALRRPDQLRVASRFVVRGRTRTAESIQYSPLWGVKTP